MTGWMRMFAVGICWAGSVWVGTARAADPLPPPFQKGDTELGLAAGASLPLGDVTFESSTDRGTFELDPGPVFSGHIAYTMHPTVAVGLSLAFAPYEISAAETTTPGDYKISVAELTVFGRMYLDPRYGWTPYVHAMAGLVRQKLSLELDDDLTGNNIGGHLGAGGGLGVIYRGTGSIGLTAELAGLVTISSYGTTYLSARVGVVLVRSR